MTKETARTLSQVFMVLSIVSVLFVCGNCCANSQKGTYGPEEVYSKGDGTYGYGAKYYNSSTDQGMLVAIIGGTLFLAFSIASAVFHTRADTLPSEAVSHSNRNTPSKLKEETKDISRDRAGLRDPLFIKALRFVVSERRASTSSLMSRFGIDYARSGEILVAMVQEGYIGDYDSDAQARPILAKAYEYLIDMDES